MKLISKRVGSSESILLFLLVWTMMMLVVAAKPSLPKLTGLHPSVPELASVSLVSTVL